MEEVKTRELKIELFIPGELKDEPVICRMIREYDVDLKIVEASFSTDSGWAYLIVSGEKNELARLFEDLQSKGIRIELKD